MPASTRIPFHRAAAGTVNPLGVHAGLWTAGWSHDEARFAIEGSAAAGFDLIEIPLIDPRSSDLLLTEALLEANGLDAVVSLALGVDSDINTDVSTPQGAASSARGEQLLLDAVEFARSIGAGYVGGVTFSAMTRYGHPATEAGRANSLAVLSRVAAVAAEAGILIGLEYVNRYESNLLNTAAQTREFIGELEARGAQNVLLHIDTFHVNGEELSQAAAVHDAGSALGYIHASENHRGQLGTGSNDWPGLFSALADTGYIGPITFESFSPAVVSAASRDDIGLWRTLWHDPTAVAAAGARFLRRQLAASDRLLSTTH
ncbi:sugar phosphate isomerase/epimerase [Herbiconiux moechotypicola]|uniref:sugar phosphate isomerase/epimerase family protein n=1 Tax=Herbiconiux moechotypicola TaxID=637393 RepID=UPI00217ED855|nr:sugar phosphate isomerase/epimerase [Herbiconiux moechotypicola]MCS5730132.1 sugar phosphate isomerase/epimerase [Herbiconiux moechotypicola]